MVLADTDAFTKLAACDLLQAVLESLGASLATTRRLPALVPMLRKGRLARRIGPERCAKILLLAEKVEPIGEARTEWLDRLALSGIDPGEAQLIALALDSEGVLLLTGDKRALEALGGVDEASGQLVGRVVCLEAALLSACMTLGVSAVKDALHSVSDLDTVLAVVAGSSDPVEALTTYLEDLVSRAPTGVLWKPTPLSGSK